MTNILLILFYSLLIVKCGAFWNLQEIFKKYIPFSQHDINEKKSFNDKELKESCDENQLLLQLARLYATSPESIIVLLCTDSISQTCQDVSNVLEHINNTVSDCKPLQADNLYIKLYNGLDYFNSYVCRYNTISRGEHLMKYHACLAELREDILDCEGPPDWFEKSNESVVCQYYKDIINCNYIKTAMLCGLDPALMIRAFSDEIMQRIVKFKCKISRSLPRVDDPMPARACLIKCHINLILYIHTAFQLCVHFSYLYM